MRYFCPSAIFDYPGGQNGDCIFTKKLIKLTKNALFLEFLAYLHFVAW